MITFLLSRSANNIPRNCDPDKDKGTSILGYHKCLSFPALTHDIHIIPQAVKLISPRPLYARTDFCKNAEDGR